jgi:hypothetical protein
MDARENRRDDDDTDDETDETDDDDVFMTTRRDDRDDADDDARDDLVPDETTTTRTTWDARVDRLREAVRRYDRATRTHDACERETVAARRRRRRARARQRVEEAAARIEALCDAETTRFIAGSCSKGAIGDDEGADASRTHQPSPLSLDDDDDDDDDALESPTTMERAARDDIERARRAYRSRRALEKTHASAFAIERSLEETRRALDAARVLKDDEDDEDDALVEIDARLRACRRWRALDALKF